MKVQFLGTCACDYSDKLQNECKHRFDNDARRSSTVLINDHIFYTTLLEHKARFVMGRKKKPKIEKF